MKIAVLTTGSFEIRDVEEPSFGDDEVLIKTTGCGICSGDLHTYRNRAELTDSDLFLGHEGAGIVAAFGEKVTGLSIGDPITAIAKPAYGECFVAKPENIVKLAPEVDARYALGGAIACCVHAGNRFGIRPGDRVAIVGCGFMGLICMQIALYQDAGFASAFDPIEYRLDMGRLFGADAAINPLEVDSEESREHYGRYDVVIEAAGVQSAIDLSTDLVKKHGRIILVGYHQSNNGLRTVNMQQWNYKAIDVVNGHVRRKDEKVAAMGQGMELMRLGHIDPKPLVTSYELDETEQAFRDLSKGVPGLFKVVLLMGN